MARREITDQMRETARERAHGYLAARDMPTADIDSLARYHARVAPFQGREAQVSARMLASLAAKRTARAWFVAPGRAVRPVRVRMRYGR
jgi:hypothetical protein